MNFRIIKHLFLADVRRLRWLVLAVLVLVALQTIWFLVQGPWDLPVSLSHWSTTLPRPQSLVVSALPDLNTVFAMAAAMLAAAVGWQGAAAQAVRPLRRREKLSAKLIFLTVFLFLPQAAAIFLVLCANGIGSVFALRAMAASAGAFVPLWLLVAAYGRLAGSFWRFTGAVLLTCAGVFLVMILAAVLKWDTRSFGIRIIMSGDAWGRYASAPVCWLLGLGLAGLLMLLAWPARSWKPWRRCLAGTLVLLVSTGFFGPVVESALPENYNQDSPVPPGFLVGTNPVAPAEFSDNSYSSGAVPGIQLMGVVGTENLPPDIYCAWLPAGGGTLSSDSGEVLRAKPWSRGFDFWRNIQTAPRQSPDFEKSISEIFSRMGLGVGKGPNSESAVSPDPPVRIPLGYYPATGDSSRAADRKFTFSGKLTGVFFRNRVLAEISLTDPDPVTVGSGWLRVRTPRTELKPGQILPEVEVLAAIPSMGWTENAVMLRGWRSLMENWRFYVCLPRLGTVFRCEEPRQRRFSPLLAGAWLEQRQCFVTDREWREWKWDIKPQDLEGARLVVLKTEIVGVVERSLTTHALPMAGLATAQPPASDFYATVGPRMDPRLFLDKLRETTPDPITASDSEIGVWLSKGLATYHVEEWLVPRLALLVPDHLDFLMEFCRVGSEGRQPCAEAIVMALPDVRKSEIIDRLEDFPWLIDVVRKRGWADDAKETLLRLLRAGKLESGMDMVVEFAGPDVYPLLLADLGKTGNLYFSLRRLPGIEPALTESVRRYFERVTVGGKIPAGVADSERVGFLNRLALPLRHGLPAAAADALVLFRRVNSGRARQGLDWMERFFQLPPGVKRDSDESRQFFLNLKPEDVRWDAFTRRWTTVKL